MCAVILILTRYSMTATVDEPLLATIPLLGRIKTKRRTRGIELSRAPAMPQGFPATFQASRELRNINIRSPEATERPRYPQREGKSVYLFPAWEVQPSPLLPPSSNQSCSYPRGLPRVIAGINIWYVPARFSWRRKTRIISWVTLNVGTSEAHS